MGCGTGRVALDLAARGHEVVAVDADPDLVAACAERARGALAAGDRASRPTPASWPSARRHPLAICPMQVVQLLGGARAARTMLAALRGHLEPGGLLAVALADPFEGVPAEEVLPPLPDVLEIDGWVLSSTPVDVRAVDGSVAIDRHRQAVSPAGELTEEVATIVLDSVDPDELAREGARAGFTVCPTAPVPETRDYVGSTVVLLEAPR